MRMTLDDLFLRTYREIDRLSGVSDSALRPWPVGRGSSSLRWTDARLRWTDALAQG
jgi:hypothetical protein